MVLDEPNRFTQHRPTYAIPLLQGALGTQRRPHCPPAAHDLGLNVAGDSCGSLVRPDHIRLNAQLPHPTS